MLPKYNKEQLENAAKELYSLRATLKYFELTPNGGNYVTIKKFIKQWNININHFTGQRWNKGRTFSPKIPLEQLLVKNSNYGSHALKKRLIKECILPHQCCQCKRTTWQGKSIPIELHHINGDRTNNELINLAILCPNCHALTDNHRGKNINNGTRIPPKKYIRIKPPKPPKFQNYCNCGAPITKKAKNCISCNQKQQYKIDWPDIDTLKQMLAESNHYRLGKQLGVSDNAIRKHIKNHSAPNWIRTST
jgi:hypothetical protein